jgi:hypothetical protein
MYTVIVKGMRGSKAADLTSCQSAKAADLTSCQSAKAADLTSGQSAKAADLTSGQSASHPSEVCTLITQAVHVQVLCGTGG